MDKEQFMACLVANLWKKEMRFLDARDPLMHHAFAETISKIGDDRLSDCGVEFYVDPINEYVSDLPQIISILQGYALASRPNPTYPRASINFSTDACNNFISTLSEQEALIVSQFADCFIDTYNFSLAV